MTRIKRRSFYQTRMKADGSEYTLYTYQLDDGSFVDSLEVFEKGERVMVWFDDKYNKAKLKKFNST